MVTFLILVAIPCCFALVLVLAHESTPVAEADRPQPANRIEELIAAIEAKPAEPWPFDAAQPADDSWQTELMARYAEQALARSHEDSRRRNEDSLQRLFGY
jgi:hypothetical protein